MTTDEIAELYCATLTEISSMCRPRVPDIFGAADGYHVSDSRTEDAENKAYLSDEVDMQDHQSDIQDRWGDRRFAKIN